MEISILELNCYHLLHLLKTLTQHLASNDNLFHCVYIPKVTDEIEGILFIDYISPFKKRLIKGKLGKISKGIVDVDYKMRFPA